MQKTKILVVTGKPYPMPEDDLYLPIFVGGGENSCGFLTDAAEDSIAEKNPLYCELTALYYAWKNMDAAYIGLFHYRRYLKGALPFHVGKRTLHILSPFEAGRLLGQFGLILPKKRHYYIETLYSHYDHTMYVEPLDEAGRIIAERCPKYSPAFDRLKKRRSAHMFNMMVARKDILDGYCSWLFPILFELEKRVDTSGYDAFHRRFFGRVSELLLDVYITTEHIPYAEVGLVSTEKINWWKKGTSFLKAKFRKEKYEKSF